MKKEICLNILPFNELKATDNALIKFPLQNLDLVWVDKTLEEISKKFIISQINVYQEVNILSNFYFEMLFNLLKIHCKNIQIYTNFISFNKPLINNLDIINVIYDFTNYDKINESIIHNIQAASNTNKIINIKTHLKHIINKQPIEIINILNKLNIKTWEIIYDLNDDTKQLTDIINKYTKYIKHMNFVFQNYLKNKKIIKNKDLFEIYMLPNEELGIKTFVKNKIEIKSWKNLSNLIKNSKF